MYTTNNTEQHVMVPKQLPGIYIHAEPDLLSINNAVALRDNVHVTHHHPKKKTTNSHICPRNLYVATPEPCMTITLSSHGSFRTLMYMYADTYIYI